MINDRDAGLDPKGSVRAATIDTTNLAVSLQDNKNNPTAYSTNFYRLKGEFSTTFDGIVLNTGDRVLVKNLSVGDTGKHNGIYVYTADPNGNPSGRFDRASDFDNTSEVTAGAFVFVEEGNTQANSGFVLSKLNLVTNPAPGAVWALGTDPQSWVQFSGSHLFTADTTTGLKIESNRISILDGGIKTTQISDGAVTSAKIANGSITGAKLANGAVTASLLSLDVATSAIALSSNGISLKGTGSSTVQLQTSADLTSGVQYLQAVWVNGGTTKITNLAPLA
jgi:hypothetical protein